MGKKEKKIKSKSKKIVLDTNVLISSLLSKGELARIVDLWKAGKIIPVVSRETFDEFSGVLGYPKFKLTKDEIRTVLEEEVLPFFEIVEIAGEVSGVCRDPDDDKFIACASASEADFIVSGDKDLRDIAKYGSIKIIKASALLDMFD